MARFDLQSAVVMTGALVSSLMVGWWINQLGDRGEARAASLTVSSTAAGQPLSTARLARSADGHYWARAQIDGRTVRLLVDTGSSVVALTRDDADRLGLDLAAADFDRQIQTAAGPARAAAVRLNHVAVDGARVKDVQALVVEQGLDHSLLGMSYLGRLEGFEATPEGLTLRP